MVIIGGIYNPTTMSRTNLGRGRGPNSTRVQGAVQNAMVSNGYSVMACPDGGHSMIRDRKPKYQAERELETHTEAIKTNTSEIQKMTSIHKLYHLKEVFNTLFDKKHEEFPALWAKYKDTKLELKTNSWDLVELRALLTMRLGNQLKKVVSARIKEVLSVTVVDAVVEASEEEKLAKQIQCVAAEFEDMEW